MQNRKFFEMRKTLYPMDSLYVVYLLLCATCFNGETTRHLSTQVKEHERTYTALIRVVLFALMNALK